MMICFRRVGIPLSATVRRASRRITGAGFGLAGACGLSLAGQNLITEEHAFSSAPLPLIPADPSPIGVSDTRTLASSIAALTDVNVALRLVNPSAGGAFNGDYFVSLSHASGYTVLLNRVGVAAGASLADQFGYADNGFAITLDDQADADVHQYRLHLEGGSLGAGPVDLNFIRPLTGTWQPDGRNASSGVVRSDTPRTALLETFVGLPARGTWTLFVADLNAGGTAILEQWSLQLTGTPVAVEPPLSPPKWVGVESLPTGGHRLRFGGTPGRTYQIESSTDLIHWVPLPDQTADSAGGFGWVNGDTPLDTAHFYRFSTP